MSGGDDDEVLLIDHARSGVLHDVGRPGWIAATTVAPDGTEHLALLDQAAIGTEHYDATCGAVSHEQRGPLPIGFAERVGLICGAPAHTKKGRPCRNRVPVQGQRCQWHRQDTAR